MPLRLGRLALLLTLLSLLTSCTHWGFCRWMDDVQAISPIGLVRLVWIQEECSGLGGTHYLFARQELCRDEDVSWVRFGGHGYLGWRDDLSDADVGRTFLAGLLPRVSPATEAWCLRLPETEGAVRWLLPLWRNRGAFGDGRAFRSD